MSFVPILAQGVSDLCHIQFPMFCVLSRGIFDNLPGPSRIRGPFSDTTWKKGHGRHELSGICIASSMLATHRPRLPLSFIQLHSPPTSWSSSLAYLRWCQKEWVALAGLLLAHHHRLESVCVLHAAPKRRPPTLPAPIIRQPRVLALLPFAVRLPGEALSRRRSW